MTRSVESYVANVCDMVDVFLYDNKLYINNGCVFLEYEYIDYEDCRNFVIDFYYKYVYSWEETTYSKLWKLYGISEQWMMKLIAKREAKIKAYLLDFWYNVQ